MFKYWSNFLVTFLSPVHSFNIFIYGYFACTQTTLGIHNFLKYKTSLSISPIICNAILCPYLHQKIPNFVCLCNPVLVLFCCFFCIDSKKMDTSEFYLPEVPCFLMIWEIICIVVFILTVVLLRLTSVTYAFMTFFVSIDVPLNSTHSLTQW